MTTPPAPPTIAQHAKAWIMHEWDDPHRRRDAQPDCDDVMHPFTTHSSCERISGTYREDSWFVRVSAQTLNPDQPVRVVVGNPSYSPSEDDGHNRYLLTQALLKAPMMLFGKP